MTYPTILPKLTLDFANSRQLDPRITFSRSSSATYLHPDTGLITTAPSDVARFEKEGLLIEEARTNINTTSLVSEPDWNSSAVLVNNSGVAPDGTFTASAAIPPSGTNQTYTNPVRILPSAGVYTLSFYIQPTSFFQRFLVKVVNYSDTGNQTVTFDTNKSGLPDDPDNGIIPNGGNNANYLGATMDKSLANGWVRLSVTVNIVGPDLNGVTQLQNGTNGDGVSSFLVWHSQLETGNFPTSLIPTPLTFTSRASTATYYDANGIIQTAGVDVARDDAYLPDENGVMRSAGLLVEEARTNLLLNSEDFDDAVWTKLDVTVTPDVVTAPDGSLTADKIVENTSNALHRVRQTLAGTTTSAIYSYSVFAKAGERSKIQLSLGQSTAWGTGTNATFDLTTGTILDIGNDALSANIQALADGWYRCELVGQRTVTVASSFHYVNLVDDSGNLTYTGDGTSGVYIWGGQFELGNFPTSYIPTTGSAVTRAADVTSSSTVTRAADIASILGSAYTSIFGTQIGAGSIFADVLVLGEKDNTNTSAFASFGTSSNSLFTSFLRYDNRLTVGFTRPSGGNIAKYHDLTGKRVKGAVSWTDLEGDISDQANASNALDGDLYAGNQYFKSSTPPLNTDYDRFGIGRTIRPSVFYDSINGHIARLAYYPVRLPDEQLQALTF